MFSLAKRLLFVLIGLVALLVVDFVVGPYPAWLNEFRPSKKVGGQQPADPFRIAGNFYYIGASDIAAFLIAGPEGHVVIDAGYPTTALMIIDSIAKLGFNIKDVKVLLNSEAHSDHAGGLAVLQQASGAEIWASDASAETIESGGEDPDMILPMRALFRMTALSCPSARVAHRFDDGDTIRVGPIALTAHITAGHTRGCTTWTFAVRDGDRMLNVVSVCDLGVLAGSSYLDQNADRERSLRTLRSLPVDIWVTNHARAWGRYRKFVASKTATNPVDAFVDPDGYRTFIDRADAELREGKAH